jgi:hypothetical protein
MGGRVLVAIGVALGAIGLERLLSAALLVSADGNDVSVRLLIAFVCGGLSPVIVAFGYFKKTTTNKATRSNPPGPPEP